jgi:hypothetical protein
MPKFISLTAECIEGSTPVKKINNARRLIGLVQIATYSLVIT